MTAGAGPGTGPGTDMGAEDNIHFERRGGLGVVTLNRPRALNALTYDMIRRFARALDEWEARKVPR